MDFLWNDSKTRLLGWYKVCMPIANDSLGIRKLITFNKALLGMWLWHFWVEETRLWRRVVVFEIWGKNFFGGGGWWIFKLERGVHRCGLWKNIRMGWELFSKN